MRRFQHMCRFRLQHAIFTVILLPLFISVVPVYASTPNSCEGSAPCRRLLLQGAQLAAAGHHEQALDVFHRALQLTGNQDVQLHKEIGRSLQLLGRIDEAVNAYRLYLQTVPQDSPDRDIVLRWLREALLAGDANQADETKLSGTSAAPAPLLPLETSLCKIERATLSKRLRVSGISIGAAGVAALLAASVLAGVHGSRVPGCDFYGLPTDCIRNTLPASIPGFVLSGLALASGATLLTLSYYPPRSRTEALCVAKRE